MELLSVSLQAARLCVGDGAAAGAHRVGLRLRGRARAALGRGGAATV